MDLLPVINQLSIADKHARIVRLGDCMNWAQRQLIDEVGRQHAEGSGVRIITLKARQMGISTIIEAVGFSLAFLIPRMKGLIVAHETDGSEHLLSMSHTYWDTCPWKEAYTADSSARNRLSWTETKSRIHIATAKNKSAARSQTLHFFHGSEVAFWDQAEIMMTGLDQAIPQVPNSFAFLESTANGIGNYFQRTWQAAEDGDVDYVPMFFPWWKHPEYIAGVQGPAAGQVLGKLNEEERTLKGFLAGQADQDTIVSIDDRLLWRRWAIKNRAQGDLLKFQQEYPAHPEEAFISTGTNVFPLQALSQKYQPIEPIRGRLYRNGDRVEFLPDEDGPLRVYRPPSADHDWGQYVIAGDPTRTTEGDYAVIQVLNRRTWEQVAVWRGRCDPTQFGTELFNMGSYYNQGIVNCEIEGPGYATIAVLLERNYPRVWENQLAYRLPNFTGSKYGWSSTWKTKQEAVGYLINAVTTDPGIVIHDAQTFHEMRNFVTVDKGFGNSDETQHDDTVTSLAIALATVRYTATELQPYGVDKPDPYLVPNENAIIRQEDLPEAFKSEPEEPAWMSWGDDG